MASPAQMWQSWSPKRRRVFAIASGAGALVLISAGAGLAASLGVSGTDLGVSSVSASCQTITTSPITPTFVYTYQAATPGYVISGVALSGLEPGCLNKQVQVVLAGSTGASVATAAGTTPSSGTTATIPLTSPYAMTSTFPTQLTIAVYS